MPKPLYMEALEGGDGELFKRVIELQEFTGRDGALPAKTKTLMMMFGDALLGRAEGVKALAERARGQGATEDEIAETVRVAFIFGGLAGLVPATHAYKKQG